MEKRKLPLKVLVPVISVSALIISVLVFIAVYFAFFADKNCGHDGEFGYMFDDVRHWKICAECDEKFDEEDHEFVSDTKYVNCLSVAEYDFSCKCGCKTKQKVDPVGHEMVDGQCTRCNNGIIYELNPDAKSYSVIGFNWLDKSEEGVWVTVPETFRSLPVTEIGEYAFGIDKYYRIIGVTLPETVTVIGNSAFKNSQITEIKLPSGLKKIGDEAFYGTEKLEKIVIPDTVTMIGQRAFAKSGIKSLTLPNGKDEVTIGGEAFRDCVGLTELVITDAVASIEDNAFLDCTSVKELTLGKGLKAVGYKSFFGMKSLEKLYYNSIGIESVSGSVMWGSDGLEYKSPERKCEIFLGDNIELVATGMFAYEQFSNVYAPSLELWFKIADVPKTSVHGSRLQPVATEKLYINGEVLTEIVVPESVTNVNGHFEGCDSVKKIVIHDGVQYIGQGVFSGLSGVESVTVGSGVTLIEYFAFGNLYNLKELYFNGKNMFFDGFIDAGTNTENGLKLYIGEKVESVSGESFASSGMSVSEVHFPTREGWSEIAESLWFDNHKGETADVYFADEAAD